MSEYWRGFLSCLFVVLATGSVGYLAKDLGKHPASASSVEIHAPAPPLDLLLSQ